MSDWEDVPKASADSGWEDVPKAPKSKFKSGDFFHETGKLIPSMDDIKKWADSPMDEDAFYKGLQNVGSGVVDIVGGLPGMIAGGAHGIWDAVSKGDASAGLETGMKTMDKMMPSTWANKAVPGFMDKESAGYKGAMAPVTALMDTFNSVPQLAGEAVNAAGYPDAAQQVTDAGKLGVMVAAGAMGAKGTMKAFKGKKADQAALDAAAKLEALRKEAETAKAPESESETTTAHANDFGVINPYNVGGHVDAAKEGRPTTIDNPQGELFGGEHLNDPMRPANDQGSLLNNEGALPYEKPGLELAPKEELPSRLQEMGKDLNQFDRPYSSELGLVPKEGENPNVRTSPEATILDSTISKEQEVAREQQSREAQQAEKQRQIEEAYNKAERQRQMDYANIEGQAQLDFHNAIEAGMPHPEAVKEAKAKEAELKAEADRQAKEAQEALRKQYVETTAPKNNAMAEKFAKAEQERNKQKAEQEAKDKRRSEEDAAYAEMEALKGKDFSAMEAQRQLDLWSKHYNIENGTGPARRAFLDRTNLDFQHLQDVVGDKSLMDREHTVAMAEALGKGDLVGALGKIAGNHPSAMYRTLATFLAKMVEGIKVSVHPDRVIRHGERDITGYYDPHSGSITLSGLGATSPHTLLHEVAHALSSQLMTLRPNDIRVKAMNNLYEFVKKSGLEREFPGIVNVKEFLAEAVSNPKFQDFLKSKKYDGRSMWRKFVDTIKNMMGIKTGIETKLGNALDHALDLSKQIMEASDKKTRDDMLSVFKEAGMGNKLADLMADKPKDTRADITTTPGLPEVVNGIPGLTSAISDFTRYDRDKPMSEIVEMAKQLPDIDKGAIEGFSQQAQAGGLFQSLKTRNPVVKMTFEKISRAVQESSRNIKNNLTMAETGLVARMRALSKNEKGSIWSVIMEHEGVKEFTSTELAAKGFSEKEIGFYTKLREISKQFFNDLNARRAELGLPPMDYRIAHIAGRFMGDFAMMVFKEGKVVGRIAGNTRAELKRAYEHIKEAHPEFEFGKQEYNGIGTGKRAGDRFGGMMEALNFLSKADGDVAKLMDSYRDFLQKDAITFRNTIQHAKDKQAQAGGIIGSEGNKPWQDAIKNAEEGMKSQLSYFERGYEWMAMQKAISDLKPLLGDAEVVKQMPNAVEWAQKYVNHALNREQGKIADAANVVISAVGEVTGLGHSNLLKWNAQVKHLVMQKFMGLGNIPFSLTQLMQPLQAHPAMLRLLSNRGLEFNTRSAMVKATETYLHALVEGHESPKLSAFEQQAMKYADQMSVFDVQMADHTRDINANKFVDGYNKLADINITVPEHLTRGMSFLMYSHILKDAGVPARDIFGAAENLTNMVMVDYRPIERPMGYAKLGWIGDLASTLTRYKHNQYSQLAFYGREGIRGAKEGKLSASTPLATFLASSIAFGGVMGFFAYNEADSAYQMFSEHVLKKPDTLNRVMMSTKPTTDTGKTMHDILTHGVFSTVGIDMTTRFSNANLIPNSIPEAVMPYGSAVWDIAQNTGRFMLDPTSPTKGKQLAKSIAPQSVSGLFENFGFTEKQKDGSNLYINNTDGPNVGKGRVARTDSEMMQRNFGFRSVRESKELADNYSDSQIQKSNKNLADGLLTKAKYAIMDGSMTKEQLSQLANKAMKEYGDDTFTSKLVSWSEDRHLTQKQQQVLRDAQGGYKGAFNIKQGSR